MATNWNKPHDVCVCLLGWINFRKNFLTKTFARVKPQIFPCTNRRVVQSCVDNSFQACKIFSSFFWSFFPCISELSALQNTNLFSYRIDYIGSVLVFQYFSDLEKLVIFIIYELKFCKICQLALCHRVSVFSW